MATILRKTAQGVGYLIAGIGILVWVVGGLWGFVLCLAIVEEVLGFFGVVLGFVFFPVLFIAAPWYALVAWGNAFPLVVCYGGGIGGPLLFGLGSMFMALGEEGV